jgi:dienelactone hydrolase
VLHRVRLVTAGDAIPSLLAVPSGTGPFPAVAVFHQHVGQRHFGKSEVFGLVGDPCQAFGPALARAGFIVLARDSLAPLTAGSLIILRWRLARSVGSGATRSCSPQRRP